MQEAAKQFQQAQRVQTSMLAAVEKKVLLWLAARTPRAINSDHLTVLGMVAMVAAGACYAYARVNKWALLWVIVCLALNWVGDSLDGTLARFRNQQRPRYGFYVDHIVDSVSAVFLLGGLGLSGYMSMWVAVLLLVTYFLLSIEVYLATYAIGTFRISFFAFGPTELRILLAIGNIALLLRGPMSHLFGHNWLLFDIGGVIGAAGMVLIFIYAAVTHTRQLYNEERLP
ncbi:MAG TPA: CDP-alcohol phosphatidyltransferase family protein [Terriglobales bacterium]|nr:CDP-alcohol phosphatidyltransferase family protein [Terriglobales bacterium]